MEIKIIFCKGSCSQTMQNFVFTLLFLQMTAKNAHSLKTHVVGYYSAH